MKKASFILLFFSFYFGVSQNSNAIKLVEYLHTKQINQAIENVEIFSSDTLKINAQVKELKTTLSKIYKDYTNEEIQSLITFYNSSSGKKLLKSQELISSKILDEIYKWEAKTQGIDVVDEDVPIIEIEPSLDLDLESTKKQVVKSNKTPKKEQPKINTLEDLKNLIKKDVNIIYDSFLLAKLLDLEELVSPTLGVEEVLPKTDIERNN